MKIIKISTDNELTAYEFPSGTDRQQNKFLRELIGNGCDIYECVMPKRLYTEWGMKAQSVCMLVDEEGGCKENVQNLIGSYLYETDKHNCPIMGNILFVGLLPSGGSVELSGIEDSVFPVLESKLNDAILKMKGILYVARE